MSDTITLTIDSRQTSVPAGATILEAARELGIDIPTLCHDEALDGRAQCRLCVVEIERSPRLEPACVTQAAEGMVVKTDSERVTAARRTILELLLSGHPRVCAARSVGGECRLCDYAEQFGVRAPAFGYGTAAEDVRENEFISRDSAACVLCTKCVRVCEQVQGIGALAVMNRGAQTQARPALGKTLEQTDCEMCGNCVAVCPTGAMKTNWAPRREETKVRTTCGYCGVGCQFDLNVREGRVVGVTTSSENPVNGRWLCVKGRFGYEFINHPDRLTTPLIRRGKELEPATWDEALGFVASRLAEIRAAEGPDAIGFMSSSRCTNEENYLMEKMARAVIGTNNVDQCART